MKNPKDLDPQCENCMFFIKNTCRRNPPTVFFIAGDFHTAFPEPIPSWLCGEWVWRHKNKKDLDTEE